MHPMAETMLSLALFPMRYGVITVVELVAFVSCLTLKSESPLLRRIISKMARIFIWGAGLLRIRIYGTRDDRTKLYICNHASYMDGFSVYSLAQCTIFCSQEGRFGMLAYV